MATIRIHSSTHVYDVTIEEGIRHRMTTLLEGDYSQILIITDETVAGRYLEEVKELWVRSDPYTLLLYPQVRARKAWISTAISLIDAWKRNWTAVLLSLLSAGDDW